MELSLINKNALICGASKGIGLAIAKELALSGANCILLARSEESLIKAIAGLNQSGNQQHHFYAIDFSNGEAAKSLIDDITSKQTIHILINNSGGPSSGPIVAAQEHQFIATFHQHLITNHILSTAVLPGMKKAGYGRIINIISTSVKIPLKNLGVSNTIRGAVASWAKTLSNEVASFGITVNNILPGMTRTGRLDELIKATADKSGLTIAEVEKKMIEEIPATRFADPLEIAAVAAFLASPAAAYVNGTSIPVDGGRTGSI